jgi:hypothetical protein
VARESADDRDWSDAVKRIALACAAAIAALTASANAQPVPAVGLYWLHAGDPTTGAGVCAPLYQLLFRTDNNTLYYKSGAACTAWTPFSGAGGGTVTGSCATLNALAKWTGLTAIGCSDATDDGTTFSIGSDFKVTEANGVGSAGGLSIADQVFDVRSYGALCNGSHDDTTAIQDAINAADDIANIATNCGGTVQLPTGVCVITSQITFPATNGGGLHQMCSMRITGTTGALNIEAGAAGGTFVLMNVGPGTGGVFNLIGATGNVEIDHITFENTSLSNTAPILYDTLATVSIHDNYFLGAGNGSNSNQDAIWLGGTESTPDNTYQSCFTGFGTNIWGNRFQGVQRAIRMGPDANTVFFHENSIYSNSGTALSGGAAIELVGTSTAGVVGNVIVDNYIEAGNYVYPVKITSYGTGNWITGTTFYDPSSETVAFFRINDSTSAYNYISSSVVSNAYGFVSDNSGGTTNTYTTTAPGFNSELGTPWVFNSTLTAAATSFFDGLVTMTGSASSAIEQLLMTNTGTSGVRIIQQADNGTYTNTLETDGVGDFLFIAQGFEKLTATARYYYVGNTQQAQDDGAGNHYFFNASGGETFAVDASGDIVQKNGSTFVELILANGHDWLYGLQLSSSNLSAGCGSGASITGTDRAGTVTFGTGATTCVITFLASWNKNPTCTVTSETAGISVGYALAPTTLSITATSSDSYDYNCKCVGTSCD